MPPTKSPRKPVPYIATALAWLIPGAGHVYLGRRLRGLIVFVTIGATFWTGIALGGKMTVDYENERWWFAADMAAGLHGLVGWYRQREVYQPVRDQVLSDRDYRRQAAALRRPKDRQDLYRAYIDERLEAQGLALVAPTETIARAYAGVAGLLNVMCIFDALVLAVMGVRGEGGLPGRKGGPPS